MVDLTDNQTLICSESKDLIQKNSLQRWFKHSCYLKRSKTFFNTAQQQQIAQAITQAENGHHGEIQVIIEASLPSHFAYQYDTLQRARYLFAKYGVWDTEFNSGLLIYLNLCAKKIELVTDRGIDAVVKQSAWDEICEQMIHQFKQGQFTEGLCGGITSLGDIFQAFYTEKSSDPKGNELPNMPRLL